MKYDFGKRGRPRKVHVKPTTELPGHTAEGLKKSKDVDEEAPDKVYTACDIEVTHVELGSVSFAEPPELPKKVRKMSDAQIRQWIRTHGFADLKDSDIEIERTDKEIEVTLKPDENTTISTSYKLK